MSTKHKYCYNLWLSIHWHSTGISQKKSVFKSFHVLNLYYGKKYSVSWEEPAQNARSKSLKLHEERQERSRMIRTLFRSSLCWQQPPFVLFSDSPSALRSCRSCILLVHGAPIRCMSSCNVRSGTTDTCVRWFSAANVRVNPSRSPGEMQEAVLCNVKLSALSDH